MTSLMPVRLLKRNDKFTYVGAFIDYWVCEGPRPDPTYPGRVLIEAMRINGPWRLYLTIRLPVDQLITFYSPVVVV